MLQDQIISKALAANNVVELVKPKLFTNIAKIILNGKPSAADLELGDIGTIITLITMIAIDFAAILSFIMILYAAFQYVTTYGDENKAKKAKETIIWAVVGFVVAVTASIFVQTLRNALS